MKTLPRRRQVARRRRYGSKHMVLFALEQLIWEKAKEHHPNLSRFLKDIIIEKLTEEGVITQEELRRALFS